MRLRVVRHRAPKKSSWLDKVGGFLETAGAHIVNGLASLSNAMVHHPGEAASLVGGLLLTEVSTLGEGTAWFSTPPESAPSAACR